MASPLRSLAFPGTALPDLDDYVGLKSCWHSVHLVDSEMAVSERFAQLMREYALYSVNSEEFALLGYCELQHYLAAGCTWRTAHFARYGTAFDEFPSCLLIKRGVGGTIRV